MLYIGDLGKPIHNDSKTNATTGTTIGADGNIARTSNRVVVSHTPPNRLKDTIAAIITSTVDPIVISLLRNPQELIRYRLHQPQEFMPQSQPRLVP